MSFGKGLSLILGSGKSKAVSNATTIVSSMGLPSGGYGEGDARKLSAVDRCLEVLSDSIAKLPIYVMDTKTRQRVNHPIVELLAVRPNQNQTPTVCKKMVETNRLAWGNGYLWIGRDLRTLRPTSLTPVPNGLVTPWMSTAGDLWYTVTHPYTGQVMEQVNQADMIHVRGYSGNGVTGVGVLQRASEVVAAGRYAQEYNKSYYANGGQPAGVLQTESHLNEVFKEVQPDGTTKEVSQKDKIREAWDKIHSGPSNAQRIAILDYGLKYTPISVSNKDAQFVQQNAINVEDIARFFGVPLYKLGAGSQSYNSNEQNAIEYVVGTLHPIVQQYEEELTRKLLTSSEIADGLWVGINMMAELRGDFNSRGSWYKTMREIGAFSINDILALEDMPDVEGGGERYASLNYVPASEWKKLSQNRNR